MSVLILDLETTGLDCHKDTIVLAGYGYGNNLVTTDTPDLDYIYSHKVLVGHNIKFDLKMLRALDEEKYLDWVRRDGLPYCTQVVEYIITGQSTIMAKLDELAEKYGGTFKDKRVSTMFQEGYGAQDVPPELLNDYLLEDLRNTQLVYEQQKLSTVYQKARSLIISQMRMLLFLAECEWNGMLVDKEKNHELVKQMESRLEQLEGEIKYITGYDCFNYRSPKHLAAYLYGWDIDFDVRVCVGVYKSGKKEGQDRYRIKQITASFPGVVQDNPVMTAKGNPKLDEGVLLKYQDIPFVEKVLEAKKLQKQLSTYHKPISEASGDRIHPNLNQCVTVTGRLSSSAPNLQNIPRGSTASIKEVYVGDPLLFEADYSQLEIVFLAFLSQDPQLIYDIVHGVDMHTVRAQALYNKEEISSEERTTAKILSFQLQYGSGAVNMSKTLGVPLDICKRFIEVYYNRYPRVKEWQEELIDKIKTTKGEMLNDGRRQVLIESKTGRHYCFTQKEAPEFMRKRGDTWSFKPTEIKNYFVQGMATGDFIPMMCGLLYVYAVKNRIPVKFVNTVHDSIIFYAKDVKSIKPLINVLDKSAELFRQLVPDFSLPLKYEIKAGKNWRETKEMT